MCGIAGFYGSWDRAALERMRPLLAHRGPDESSVFEDPLGPCGLVHARLSIIDVMEGHQPLHNEDGSVTVIFNGEIYNHEAIRRDLIARGHRFASRSDGEVLAHLYEEKGIGFVSALRGMFAIALWDRERRRLYLVRDRFGIKPLYYRDTAAGILFASEIKAILGVQRVREIDPQALEWYLSFRYVPEDRTLFAGIRKLPPAHWMEIGEEGIRVARYWDLRDVAPREGTSETAWVDELRDRLDEAVRIRLMSDVPLGAFLSGGIDSSFIVGLMTGAKTGSVETFSFGVGTNWHNESRYAEIVSETFRTSHHTLSGDCDDLDLLTEIVWHLDEPLADTAVIPTYLLSKLTREHVTVVLTGEGADELLGGYDKYKVLILGDRAGRVLPGAPLGAMAGLVRRWQRPHRALRFLSRAADRADAYMELVAVFNADDRRRLLTPDLAATLAAQEPAREVVARILARCHGPSYLDDLFHVDLQTWLVDDVLLKADKMTMAHGLEGRVPFLDHEFAEFCASMPAALKLKRWREKHALREAMRGMVPETIVDRRKHGFTVALKPWVEGGAGSLVHRVLSREHLRRRGWVNPRGVERLLGEDPDHPYVRRQIFALVMLELWAEVFLDSPELPSGKGTLSVERLGADTDAAPKVSPVLLPGVRAGVGRAIPKRGS